MKSQIRLVFIGIICACLYGLLVFATVPHPDPAPKKYYFSPTGNDQDEGSKEHPWQTIDRFNRLPLRPGDAAYFEGGGTFNGTLRINQDKSGNEGSPVTIGSYGRGNATIDAGDSAGSVLYLARYLNLSGLRFKGSGRKNGNVKDGIAIINCAETIIDSVDISGFQKSGLLVYSSAGIGINHVVSHDNGSAGITVEGNDGKKNSRQIRILYCSAINNPGDPTNLNNHSGNGIVVGHCTGVKIAHCMATENGWDMPRIGNGPVGIWAYEADSVTIEHCLSFRNKTSPGAADGGGFDLDGGVTNSVIQYCLSYENQGSGYCMFQYWGASPWYNNVIRFNISENDGTVSDSHGGAYVWNSSGDPDQLKGCDFYNNTIYNSRDAALSYSEKSRRKQFRFFNNIFVGEDSIIRGDKGSDQFVGNNWWSLHKKFNADGMVQFQDWSVRYGLESKGGKMMGMNADPGFRHAGKSGIRSADSLRYFDAYCLPAGSELHTKGADLQRMFGIDPGTKDFQGINLPPRSMGACSR
jgi:hypothetical protein